jgi:DNA-binding transcriptional regulator LsrR (DeoR family)
MRRISEDTRRRATEISRLFFEQNLSKSEISRRKGMSVTHVNRILKEAGQLGILEVTVRIPRLESLETQLRETYGLRRVRVIQTSEDKDTTRLELASTAAEIFDEIVNDGMTIGFSSGRTLFEMASKLPEKARPIKIFPLNVIFEEDVVLHGPSANTVTTIAWFRSRPSSEAFHVELFAPVCNGNSQHNRINDILHTPKIDQLKSHVNNLDAYFLTTSLIRSDSLLSKAWESRGLDNRGVRDKRIVGDVAFNVFDENGHEISSGIEDLMFKVDLSSLKIAAASVKPVVMIAGGDKSGAILAGARGHIFNTLITDSDTAEFLIKNRGDRGYPDVA